VKTSIDEIVEVEIDRPLVAVWSFIADFERISEWIEEYTETRKESDGPVGLGTVVRYTLERGNRSATWEIVEWDPPHLMAWDGSPLGWMRGAARPRGSHQLTEIGEGRTRVVSHYRPELSGALVLLKPYLSRWVRRERGKTGQMLKALIEAGPES
jgi:uncharacterized protein YndB with AHSA1/START domain